MTSAIPERRSLTKQLTAARIHQPDVECIPLDRDPSTDPAGRCAVVGRRTSS